MNVVRYQVDAFEVAATVEERSAAMVILAETLWNDKNLGRSAMRDDARLVPGLVRALQEEGGERLTRVAMCAAAAKVVRALGKYGGAEASHAFCAAGGLPPLIAVLGMTQHASMWASWALANLAEDNSSMKRSICAAGALAPLVGVVAAEGGGEGDDVAGARERAAHALGALTQGELAHAEQLGLTVGGVGALLGLLRDGDDARRASPEARLRAAFAV